VSRARRLPPAVRALLPVFSVLALRPVLQAVCAPATRPLCPLCPLFPLGLKGPPPRGALLEGRPTRLPSCSSSLARAALKWAPSSPIERYQAPLGRRSDVQRPIRHPRLKVSDWLLAGRRRLRLGASCTLWPLASHWINRVSRHAPLQRHPKRRHLQQCCASVAPVAWASPFSVRRTTSSPRSWPEQPELWIGIGLWRKIARNWSKMRRRHKSRPVGVI